MFHVEHFVEDLVFQTLLMFQMEHIDSNTRGGVKYWGLFHVEHRSVIL